MSKERGSFNRYTEECRAGAIAEIGQAEARGFNVRALKKHIRRVDGLTPCPESAWERDWREYEEEHKDKKTVPVELCE